MYNWLGIRLWENFHLSTMKDFVHSVPESERPLSSFSLPWLFATVHCVCWMVEKPIRDELLDWMVLWSFCFLVLIYVYLVLLNFVIFLKFWKYKGIYSRENHEKMTILMNIISVHSSLLMHDSIQDVIGSKVVSTPRCPRFSLYEMYLQAIHQGSKYRLGNISMNE